MNKYFLYCSRYIHFQLYLMVGEGQRLAVISTLLVTLLLINLAFCCYFFNISIIICNNNY